MEHASGLPVPFCTGRTDAEDGAGWSALSPNTNFNATASQLSAAAALQGLTPAEMVALAGRPRSARLMQVGGGGGVDTSRGLRAWCCGYLWLDCFVHCHMHCGLGWLGNALFLDFLLLLLKCFVSGAELVVTRLAYASFHFVNAARVRACVRARPMRGELAEWWLCVWELVTGPQQPLQLLLHGPPGPDMESGRRAGHWEHPVQQRRHVPTPPSPSLLPQGQH